MAKGKVSSSHGGGKMMVSMPKGMPPKNHPTKEMKSMASKKKMM